MQVEYNVLMANKAWELVDLPFGNMVIRSLLVFKIQTKAYDGLDKYKAHLVAQGYAQTTNLDYNKTYSPTVKATTILIILTLVLHCGWTLRQLDVNNAFLN